MKTKRRNVNRKSRKVKKLRKQKAGGIPWKCSQCGMMNYSGDICMGCGASKP